MLNEPTITMLSNFVRLWRVMYGETSDGALLMKILVELVTGVLTTSIAL